MTRVLRIAAVAAAFAVAPLSRAHAQCPDGTPPPCRTALAPRGVAGPHAMSVAVLYFDTRDSADAYLADGLTEEIATSLGRVSRLEVKSPSAVRRVQRANEGDLRAIGRGLNVFWVVEGSVRRSAGQLRVSARLVNAANETATWSDAFTRPTADLFAIQSDVAREVATGIAGTLAPAERTGLARRATSDPRAYDRLLLGNFLLARRSQESIAEAFNAYREAGNLDPRLATARARAAYALALAYNWNASIPGIPRDSLIRTGLLLADQALRLDSASSDGWMARGYLLFYADQWTMAGAEESFIRAITLDPGNAEAHHQYASVLFALGDDSAAVREIDRALAIEPGRVISLMDLAWFGRRDVQRSRMMMDSAMRLDPVFSRAQQLRAEARFQVGDWNGALAEADSVIAQGGTSYLGSFTPQFLRAAALAMLGDSTAARELLRAGALPWERPRLHLALGDTAAALDDLERLKPPRRTAGYWGALRGPEFDALRSSPRFQRMLAEARPPGARGP